MDHEYIQTKEKSSYGEEKDSCLKCGKTKIAHIVIRPRIVIVFGGRAYEFKDWDEAKERYFFPV